MWPMMPRALVLLLFVSVGCTTAHDPATPRATDDDTGDEDGVCRLNATVTVHVRNQSSFDVQITFGNYRVARAAEGFSRTTYNVQRVHLRDHVRLSILRGGIQLGPDPLIQTEAVFCNDATLVIGPRPRYSVFYGDKLHEPVPSAEAEEVPADSAGSEAEDPREPS